MNASLIDFPLPVVLNVCGKHTGVLTFDAFGSAARLELHVHGGRLRRFIVNGTVVTASSRIRGIVRDLNADAANVAFRASTTTRGELDLTITGLLLAALSEHDLLEQHAAELVGLDVRFLSANPGRSNRDLDHVLAAFLDTASGLLARGATARELGLALDLDFASVRLALTRLADLGAVAPSPITIDTAEALLSVFD